MLGTLNSWDKYFDPTFTGVVDATGTPPLIDVCRPVRGVQLMWLTRGGGWDYYVFRGKPEYAKDISARTKIKQNRSTRQQKETVPSIVLRTLDIQQNEANRVAAVYDSSSVYLVDYVDNSVKVTYVSIDEGSFQVYSAADNATSLQVTIKLPSYEGQRI